MSSTEAALRGLRNDDSPALLHDSDAAANDIISNNRSASGHRLIIDTDAGVDDACALLCALRLAPKLEHRVELITTSFGNCSLGDVGRNVAKCVKMAGASGQVEIATGAAGPLRGTAIDASYFHGKDGLGDVNPSDEGFCPLTGEEEEAITLSLSSPASSRILQICGEEGSVTIITLGPLTNLALALQVDSSRVIRRSCRKLVIMGGCGNARGNVSRVAEFNIAADPEAASLVFEEVQSWGESCEVVVVGWDLCVEYPMPWSAFDAALLPTIDRKMKSGSAHDGPTLREFVRAICRKGYFADRQKNGGEDGGESGQKRANSGAVICDALAVCVALFPAVATRSTRVHVDIETTGSITRGMTVLCHNHCYDGVERERTVSWVEAVDVKLYGELFDAALTEG